MRLRNDLSCRTWDGEYKIATWLSELVLVVCWGTELKTSSVRVLVIEDSEPFRKFVCSIFGRRPEFQIIGEALDGLEGVQKAEQLLPDLIVLDIGLPSLNGIEVAWRVRKVSRASKILFVSQESSIEVAQAALATGARGYILKTDAGRELIEGANAVLRGDQFVSSSLSALDFSGASETEVPVQELRIKSVVKEFQVCSCPSPRGPDLF
jgi:DNA-binding NarL/FixJ family response regulator